MDISIWIMILKGLSTHKILNHRSLLNHMQKNYDKTERKGRNKSDKLI